MKLVVPYSNLHPVTRQVIESYKLGAQFVALGGPLEYGRLLRWLWQEEETVVIVEHDIVPWPGAVEELYNCMGMWCSCSYLYAGGYGLYHGLGCTKISGNLMRALPHLWDGDLEWFSLDQRLLFAARTIGYEPHPHRPPVIHLGARSKSDVA
jgi:hypothetical protein